MYKLFGVIFLLFAAGLFGIGKYNYEQLYSREEEDMKKEVEQLKQSMRQLNPNVSDEDIQKALEQGLDKGPKDKGNAAKPLSELIHQRAKARAVTAREFVAPFHWPFSLMEAIIVCSGLTGLVLFIWGSAMSDEKPRGSQLNF